MSDQLRAERDELLAALKATLAIVDEIHKRWDEGMRAGKRLIALLDPALHYRADITAIHAAMARAEVKP